MWGKSAINSAVTMDGYEKSTPDRVVKNIKDVISALKYMRDVTISQILVAQKNRVGGMLEQMDRNYVPNIQKTDGAKQNYARWQYIGLQGHWNTFMRGRADFARTKAESYINTYLEHLETGYVNPVAIENANLGASASPPDPQAQAALVLIGKIQALRKEVDNMPTWTNPF